MEEESKSPFPKEEHKRYNSDIFNFSGFASSITNNNLFNLSTQQTPDSSFFDQSHQPFFKPTKVIFVRGLSNETSEFDIQRVLSQFGEVEKVKLLIQKNQAFVEFKSIQSAQNCLDYQEDVFLNNRKIHFSFSEDRVEQFCSEPNKVLLVTITNIKFPVNAEVLYTVFLKYGDVCKVVVFQRMQGEQALIEMKNLEQAQKAKEDLDGKFIYSNSNLMKIQYSQLKNLEVNQQNERARDFTSARPFSYQSESGMSDEFSKEEFMNLFKNAYNKVNSSKSKNVNIASVISSSQLDQKHQKLWDPLMDPRDLEEVAESPIPNKEEIALNSSTSCIFQNEEVITNQNQHVQTKILIVSNLPFNTTPLVLFKLFGVYGNVMKVKIMYKKRDTALVEFQDSSQAGLAKLYLNGISFFGSKINVNDSKAPSISIPLPGTEEANLTVDYSFSKEHRFKIQGSKNIQNITAPSEILHISNFGFEMANEMAFRNLFAKVAQPAQIKFFQAQGKQMAFAKFYSVNDAVRVLVIFHNYDLKGLHLKLSFSKTSF